MALSYVPGWSAGVGLLAPIVIVVILVLAALFVGGMTRAAFAGGEAMERPNHVRQWYGYTVCLIAIVTGLICVTGVLDHAFDLSNPLAESNAYGGSLSSFAAYQAAMSSPPAFPVPDHSPSDTASVATLRARYEALRADRIAQARFAARKGLVGDLVLLAIAVTLFVTHWGWLRRGGGSEPAVPE